MSMIMMVMLCKTVTGAASLAVEAGITVEKRGADKVQGQSNGSHYEHELRILNTCCTLTG